jgi:zinc protease
MRLSHRAALCIAALLSFPVFADAPPPAPTAVTLPAGVEKLSAVEGLTEYRLANGLRVLLAPDAGKPTTTVNITYLVGSRMENYGETGMAHLLEHLVFKGTPSLANGQLVAELKKRGMSFNGSTWYDRTNYHETFAASDDNLDWALKMEADRMVNSFIARKDLDSEMTVVRNEMESGENEPSRILWEKMTAAAYQWHSYGKSTIGARSDVENVNIERLQAFYRKFYQPDNAVLTVTGKFDETATLARIAADFGAIPKPTRVIAPTYTVEPVQDGPREVTLERVGDSQHVASLYHAVPGAHPDMAALKVLGFLLADSPSGRLYKKLVETHKATSVDVFPAELSEPGYMAFFVQLDKKQSRAAALKILDDEVENFDRQPVTAAELQRAKTAYANAFEKTLADPVRLGVALSEAIALGDWRLFFLDRDRIEAVTAADVQRVARTYFKPSNRTVGQFVPTDKPDRVAAPAMKPVEEMVAGYTGKKALDAGEAFDPSPENIEKRTTRTALPNGMKLALLPKKTRGETVNGSFILRMGDVKSLMGQRTVGQFTASMLTRGAGGKSRQQIADALDALKANLSISSGDGNAVSVSFETRRDKLADFLKLLRDILRAPSFPASELALMQNETVTGLDDGRREPQALASRALARYDNPYPRGDVRYAATLDEEIADVKAVKAPQLAAFHKRFYGADHAQFALVGDFDAAAVQAQLTQLFGDWKSSVPYARVPDPYCETKPGTIKLETPDKANAFYVGGTSLPMRDDASDWPQLVLANRVLGGGGGLKSRIGDRLRQKEGISYGAGTSLQGNPYEPNASLVFYAIYAPQNLERLKAGFSEEFERFLRDGVTEQELTEAKSGLLQEIQVGRTRDGALAGLLCRQLNLGRDMSFDAARDRAYAAATVADVNEALRKHFGAAKVVNVYAGSFAAPPAGTPAPAPAAATSAAQ